MEGARQPPPILRKPLLQKASTGSEEQKESEKRREIKREHLINKLNYINFQGGSIRVFFNHPIFERSVSIPAKPLPCSDDTLYCTWVQSSEFFQKLKSYRFKYIQIPDGQRLISVPSEAVKITRKGIRIRLPDFGRECRSRRTLRYNCIDTEAQILQNGVALNGALIDFNAYSFRAEMIVTRPQNFRWINPDVSVNLVLSHESETLYSGPCKILRQTAGQERRIIVLVPERTEINRFNPKEYRSMRQELGPQPDILFKHPLTGKLVSLKVIDLSGSGFSIEENARNALLLPGMIIPEIELTFGKSFQAKCRVQVIYQRLVENEKKEDYLKCGLSILDMEVNEQVKLLSLLQLAADDKSYVCNLVNMDELWNFFFETGFVYPQKYIFLEKKKAQIKKLYEKLYTQNPCVARHFIYQKHGRILGHVAMFRFYEYNWLIHHYAASASGSNRAGLMVLNQIGRFINDSHRLPSLHMDYVSCFYRPENKFPSRVFGGVHRDIKNQRGCSLDTFAYFHCEKEFYNHLDLWKPWELTKTQGEDLEELKIFYGLKSNGLMLKAFDLEPGLNECDTYSQEYKRIGLKRERHLFSLRRKSRLKAVILVDITDFGFNFSDLTNSIKIIVIDSKGLSKEIIGQTLSLLLTQFDQCDMPTLLYPTSFAEVAGIPYEKNYNLWVLSMEHTDAYFRYLERMLRFIQH